MFPHGWHFVFLVAKAQLEEAESILLTENLGTSTPLNDNRKLEEDKNSWEVALWPVKGVVCLRLVSAVICCPSDQLVDALCSLVRQLPLVPPRVQALVHNMADSQLTATAALMAQLSQSQIVTQPKKWLMWGSLSEREGQQSETENYLPDKRKPVEHVSFMNDIVNEVCLLVDLFV